MELVRTPLHKILQSPFVYETLQASLGANFQKKVLLKNYVRLQSHQKVLDLGCGTGEILKFIDASIPLEYHGVDINSAYINIAKEKFGNRGHFSRESIEEFCLSEMNALSYDWCLMFGFAHHLDNKSVLQTLRCIEKVLKPDGRLVLIDPVLHESQSRISQFFVKSDRGLFIREEVEYRRLIRSAFPNTSFEIRNDLLRIPYSNIISVAKKID